MNEITRINPVVFRSYTAQSVPVSNPIDNKERSFNPDFYIDSKSAEALRNNILATNPTDITRPMSVEDYKNKLINGGLQEGIDFDVMESDAGESIFVQNKNGDPTKAVFWQDGVGADNFVGYHDVSYPVNMPDVTEIKTGYNRNNKMEFKETRYKNPENHQELFPQNIGLNTTAQDYLKMLPSDANIEVHEDVDANNVKRSFIIESDANNEPVKITSFDEYPDGSRFVNQSYPTNVNGVTEHEINLISDGPYSEISTIENYHTA